MRITEPNTTQVFGVYRGGQGLKGFSLATRVNYQAKSLAKLCLKRYRRKSMGSKVTRFNRLHGVVFVAVTLLVAAIGYVALRSSTGSSASSSKATAKSSTTQVEKNTLSADNSNAKVFAHRPVEVPKDGYVGNRSCQECHPHEHAMWHQSYHRTMTQRVTPASVLGEFDGASVSAFGDSYRHIQQDDKFFVEMLDPFWKGAGDAPLVRRELVMSTGSHHMQVYWYESGDHRTVIQAPMAYLLEEQRWVPVQSTFLKPPLESMSHVVGGWNQACNMCHATGSRPGLHDPQAVDTQVSEFGIACEACHGPGENHVHSQREIAAGNSGEANITDAIFNPGTADARVSSQACGQCHGIWVARTPQQFEQWKEHGFEYRPGGDLNARRYVMTGVESEDVRHAAGQLQADPNFLRDRFWSDGMVRISGREYNGLVRSPCYEHGDPDRGIMQCTSCHQMHPASSNGKAPSGWNNDQLSPSLVENGNSACLQCHEELGEQIEQHTHHGVDSAGSQCMNCHMPHTTYGLYKAIRSHQVSSPSVQSSLNTGRPNACNQCHLDKTFAWAAEHLDVKFGVEPPDNMRKLQERFAAGPLWSLAGDAGQRALAAWSMGWRPAQEASETDWMVPYLAQGLIDPYDAVRLIAYRSLQTIPGYEDTQFDFVADKAERQAAASHILSAWRAKKDERERTGGELLIRADGTLHNRTWEQMYNARDNRPVNLEE